jgi:hypothetical protein
VLDNDALWHNAINCSDFVVTGNFLSPRSRWAMSNPPSATIPKGNPMTNAALTKALEDIYASLHNDNEDLDQRIIALKILLHAEKTKAVEIDPAKIPQPNRQGRKMLQSYFQKRGITVIFSDRAASGAA